MTDPSENRLHLQDKHSSTRFLIDSGSVVSLLSKLACVPKLQLQPLVLHAANQSTITIYGTKSLALNLGFRRDYT